MLNDLRSIVQEVNSARDLQTALDVIVSRVRSVMGTEVCTVYILDPIAQRWVFMATEGLNKDMQGTVSLGLNEGLVGLVASREEPINLDNAEAHPSFHFLPGIGEEVFSSFMGVPIIHHRKVLGVLVVQQRERRRFDQSEEAFLITMSAQLAGVIAHAQATGTLNNSGYGSGRTAEFRGVGSSPGIGLGIAKVVAETADMEAVPARRSENTEAELALFQRSVEAVRADMERLGQQLAHQLRPEEQALFDVYVRMLDDAALGAEVRALIEQGEWAQGALSQVVLEHVRTFEMMQDPYLRERAADVKDLGRRVLTYLQQDHTAVVEYPDNTILVGEELTASILGEVPTEKLRGIVSVEGSSNSHLAIMARAMGIPTIMGAVDLPYTQLDGRDIIVDGYAGVVYTNPSVDIRSHYNAIVEEERLVSRGLEALKDLPCETPDHHRVPLLVNTGLAAEVIRSLERGAEGVGLYRTEVPFLMRERFPSEEEQRQIYREQLEAFAPKPVTMRTLDIGGDKGLPYFPIEELNPSLGWRGIRVTLDHPEIFLGQVRAMLKASVGLGNLRIMLPMISTVEEVEDSKALIHRAFHELREEGISVDLPPVGVMVEVPAAVYLARQLARRVDFLSVGSNDLTQYLIAVDRNNARVADLYNSFHPAVLAALQSVARDAHAEGKPIGICGEMAGDPGAALLLMAMGYDVLSMNANNLPKVKAVLRAFTLTDAKALLAQAMQLDSAQAICDLIEWTLERAGITRLFRPVKKKV